MINGEIKGEASALGRLLRLRILVAYLGERTQYGWWASSFLGATGASVLAHPFPKTGHLAQYHGAVEAARKVHDEFIGVGQVFHPFRVPEETEQDLHGLAMRTDTAILREFAKSPESALFQLNGIAGTPSSSAVGPVLIGAPIDLLRQEGLDRAAAVYLASFRTGQRAYPYFKAA